MTLTNLNEPVTGSVTVSGTPVVGQTLTAANTLADPDGLGALHTNGTATGCRSCWGTLLHGNGSVDGLDGAYAVALYMMGSTPM